MIVFTINYFTIDAEKCKICFFSQKSVLATFNFTVEDYRVSSCALFAFAIIFDIFEGV
jgi:hypothetical protein